MRKFIKRYKVWLICLILLNPFLWIWLRGVYRLWSIPNIGEPFDVALFLQTYEDSEQNAAVNYLQAELLLIDPRNLEYAEHQQDLNEFCPDCALSDFHDAKRKASFSWNSAPKLLRKYLELNRPALDQFHAGALKPFALYHAPADVASKIGLDELRELPGGKRSFDPHVIWDGWHLSLMEASRLESEGKLDEAWEYHKSLLNLEAQYSHRTPGRLGTWYYKKIRDYDDNEVALARFLSHKDLTVEQLKRYYREVKQIYESLAPSSTRYKWAWLAEQYRLENYEPAFHVISWMTGSCYSLSLEQQRFERLSALWLHNQLKYCDLPVHKRPEFQSYHSQGKALFWDRSWGWLSHYPVEEATRHNNVEYSSADLEYAYWTLWYEDLEAADMIEMYLEESQELYDQFQFALLGIAIQCYQREHGELPRSLTDLTPEFIDEFPINPEASLNPVKYEKRVGGFKLGRGKYWDTEWSVPR